METALAGAHKLEKKLYPDGIGKVDVIIQDAETFYIYSRNKTYPYKKVRTWRDYQVYTLKHRKPPEHEMWGCAGGPPSVMEVEDRRIVAEYSVRCAPWGSFKKAQERKKNYYRFAEAYWATLLHEYGHQYEAMKEQDPTTEMIELRRRAKELPLPEGVDRALMTREAFAEYVELIGSKKLYPKHYKRMCADALAKSRPDEHGHHEALTIAYWLHKGVGR
jgi:hypothetical protein